LDFKKFYDSFWLKKEDEYDPFRLNLVAERVNTNEKVLDIGGHVGWLAEKIQKRGAEVTVTDISKIARFTNLFLATLGIKK
jgi:2-polyprenyl-3-methyl-5-hydroxy-6-metoxy-1,4-benzoquinol methylase